MENEYLMDTIPMELAIRVEKLYTEIAIKLENLPLTVDKMPVAVSVDSPLGEICNVLVLDEAYEISTSVTGWDKQTTYLCSLDETHCVYYVDSLDECIGEIYRLVIYAAKLAPSKKEINFTKMVSSCGLDKPDNWKKDVRPEFQKLFAPLIDGTHFYFTVNTTDSSSKILELRDKTNTSKRLLGAAGKRNMEINVFFNHDFYVAIDKIIGLPANKRPNKSQEHVTVSLEKLWDIICAATGKTEFLSNNID